MDAQQVLARCSAFGVRVDVAGKMLRPSPPSQVSPELLEVVKVHKSEILTYLSESGCNNPFSPYSAHEYAWERNPYSCTCYREFGRVHWCQGAPCRWMWPSE